MFKLFVFAGSGSCTRLLQKGHWREERGEEIWQPFGCMMHQYQMKYFTLISIDKYINLAMFADVSIVNTRVAPN